MSLGGGQNCKLSLYNCMCIFYARFWEVLLLGDGNRFPEGKRRYLVTQKWEMPYITYISLLNIPNANEYNKNSENPFLTLINQVL